MSESDYDKFVNQLNAHCKTIEELKQQYSDFCVEDCRIFATNQDGVFWVLEAEKQRKICVYPYGVMSMFDCNVFTLTDRISEREMWLLLELFIMQLKEKGSAA